MYHTKNVVMLFYRFKIKKWAIFFSFWTQ